MLTVADLFQEIKKGNVCPVYLIMGNDAYTQDLFLKTLIKAVTENEFRDFNLFKIDKVNSVYDFLDAANSIPVFANKRLIIIKDQNIFNPGYLSESDINSLKGYLDNPNQTTCLVFLVRGSIDKRTKLYKQFVNKAKIIDFIPPERVKLANWIRREFLRLGKQPDNQLVNFLAVISNNNLYFLVSEISKISLYSDKNKIIKLDDVRGVMSKTVDSSIFHLCDYLIEKKLEKALHELGSLINTGEPLVRINYMIARQFRMLIDAKLVLENGGSEKDFSQKLKKHSFLAPKLIRQAALYDLEKLIYIYKKLLAVDIALKRSSSKSRHILEKALIEIMI